MCIHSGRLSPSGPLPGPLQSELCPPLTPPGPTPCLIRTSSLINTTLLQAKHLRFSHSHPNKSAPCGGNAHPPTCAPRALAGLHPPRRGFRHTPRLLCANAPNTHRLPTQPFHHASRSAASSVSVLPRECAEPTCRRPPQLAFIPGCRLSLCNACVQREDTPARPLPGSIVPWFGTVPCPDQDSVVPKSWEYRRARLSPGRSRVIVH